MEYVIYNNIQTVNKTIRGARQKRRGLRGWKLNSNKCTNLIGRQYMTSNTCSKTVT